MIHTFHPVQLSNRDGGIHANDQLILSALALSQAFIGTHALEIGTLFGETTAVIASCMPKHTIITVDLPFGGEKPKLPVEIEDEKYFNEGQNAVLFPTNVESRIQRKFVDSANMQLGEDVQLGFSFLDGSHSEQYVLNDFKLAYEKTLFGGLIVLHDYGSWAGVALAVEKLNEVEWVRIDGSTLIWCRK